MKHHENALAISKELEQRNEERQGLKEINLGTVRSKSWSDISVSQKFGGFTSRGDDKTGSAPDHAGAGVRVVSLCLPVYRREHRAWEAGGSSPPQEATRPHYDFCGFFPVILNVLEESPSPFLLSNIPNVVIKWGRMKDYYKTGLLWLASMEQSHCYIYFL